MHKLLPIIVILAMFTIGFFAVRSTLSKIYADIKSIRPQTTKVIETKNYCDDTCKKEIADQVLKSIATLSANPKTIATNKLPLASAKPQDSYMQIAGSGETTKMDWTDVPGTDFSFDVTRDFGPGAHFAWECFLRVANANGQAFARIYDATHGIGVDGSVISAENVSDFTRGNSTNLNFWSGRNTYRVQIKSLNSFAIGYMGGKIRVSY
jgi:hypothetical protein